MALQPKEQVAVLEIKHEGSSALVNKKVAVF